MDSYTIPTHTATGAYPRLRWAAASKPALGRASRALL